MNCLMDKSRIKPRIGRWLGAFLDYLRFDFVIREIIRFFIECTNDMGVRN